MRYDKTTKQLVLKKFQLGIGIGICSIASDFGIDRSTIRIWRKQYNYDLANGDTEFSKYYEVKIADRTGTRVYDYNTMKEFIDNNPSSTQSEIIREFKCSKGTVWNVLNHFDYSHKKNALLIKNKIQ